VARDTSFYYAFLMLPPAKRNAIVAVWDFCRAVDDAVDEAGAEGQWPLDAAARQHAEQELALWRSELARCFEPAAPEPQTRQGRALRPLVAEFRLPRQPFEDLIDGVAMDLAIDRYETIDELLEYCRRVASAVGLVCIEIFGCRDAGARDYAINLGLALQLTNIVRDVGVDLARGRVYLPQGICGGLGAPKPHCAKAWSPSPCDRCLPLRPRAHASTSTAPPSHSLAMTRGAWSRQKSWARSTRTSSAASKTAGMMSSVK
jgi:phytoene/squalene synthetase